MKSRYFIFCINAVILGVLSHAAHRGLANVASDDFADARVKLSSVVRLSDRVMMSGLSQMGVEEYPDNYTWSSESPVKPYDINRNCKKGIKRNKVCLRKCCNFSHTLINRHCVKTNPNATNPTPLELSLYIGTTFVRNVSMDETFYVVYGRMVGCTQKNYDLRPDLDVEDMSYLQPDGRLFLVDIYIEQNRFCVDYGDKGFVQVLVCFSEEQPQISALKCIVLAMVILLTHRATSFVHLDTENATTHHQCPSGATCMRKCCDEFHIMINNRCRLRQPYHIPLTLPLYTKERRIDYFNFAHFTLVQNICDGYTLDPDGYPEDTYYLQKDGSLYMPVRDDQEYILASDYCVEVFYNDSGEEGAPGSVDGKVVVMVCPDEEAISMTIFQGIGMIVSIPFLVLTLFVYIILPDRNIPAKIIMCFVSTLILAYAFLISLQIGSMETDNRCDIIAIICHYFFLSSFLWMNVSCIDIYWTFSGLRGFGGSKKAELKRFALYVAYASGLPLIISGGVFGLNYHPDTKAWFHPKIGVGRCWFEEKTPVLLYFYGPLGLIIFTNILLFILTSLKIRKVRKDTVMLKRADSRRHNADEKERFNLYVKLLFAMGVNWSLEIISWAVITYSRVPAMYWILTDFCNAIYGVSIFLIFVFKRKTLIQLKKRYNQCRRRSDATGTMQDETENTLTSSVSHQKNSMLLK